MAKVTICIPVYRASAFLRRTLEVVLLQTYRDIRVELAIEPPGTEEARICEPFAADDRVHYRVNDRVLGWAENIAAMLRRVSSPFFVVLPHDDFLHPRYVEWLLPVVENDPRVVTAYGDIQLLRGTEPARRSQILDEGDVAERLVSFLAAGAEAPPWRGVTRSDILAVGDFPVDAYQGFLVECEWSFHLLTRGVARRLPRTLYFKRFHDDGRVTASIARSHMDAAVRRTALIDHGRRLYRRAVGVLAPSPELDLVRAGIDAIVARRFLAEGLTLMPEMKEQLNWALAVCRRQLSMSGANRILALVHTVLAQCHLQDGGDRATALDRVEQAAAADPHSPLALSLLARLRLDTGDTFGALLTNAALNDIAPWFEDADAVRSAAEIAFLRTLSGDGGGQPS